MSAESFRDDRRPHDSLAYERGIWGRGHFRVAGIDEVGRGPLAGPVVATAVVLREGMAIEGATDSKKLTARRRARLAAEILAEAAGVGIGVASVEEIDRVNIRRAVNLAMDRALRALPVTPAHIVVDGRPLMGVDWAHEAVVKGDSLIHSIACASIVAKVFRDRMMRKLGRWYPGYGWERNMGYGTPEHLAALKELGPSPYHRRTFGGLPGDGR
jgi:ribonuclease HII